MLKIFPGASPAFGALKCKPRNAPNHQAKATGLPARSEKVSNPFHYSHAEIVFMVIAWGVLILTVAFYAATNGGKK